jgi:hypothetical protein
MIYQLSLRMAGIIAGALLVLISVPGLVRPAIFQQWAKHLPRSRVAGFILFTFALAWSFWLLATMEMGEFAPFRKPLLIFLPIGYVLVLRFVDEFLAVRALGVLCLLAAEPLLDAAFLRYEGARLVITVFAYILVIVGLFWVTMPYLLRDQLDWTSRTTWRWRSLHGIMLAYGAAMLVLGLTIY